jgi:hypothetical protein
VASSVYIHAFYHALIHSRLDDLAVIHPGADVAVYTSRCHPGDCVRSSNPKLVAARYKSVATT